VRGSARKDAGNESDQGMIRQKETQTNRNQREDRIITFDKK
jgi:hypothetical protein